MELAARGETPNCPIAIQDAWRTGRLRRSVLPGRSVHRRTNESPRVLGGSRPELACPCPLVNVGPGNPASEGTCVEPKDRRKNKVTRVIERAKWCSSIEAGRHGDAVGG